MVDHIQSQAFSFCFKRWALLAFHPWRPPAWGSMESPGINDSRFSWDIYFLVIYKEWHQNKNFLNGKSFRDPHGPLMYDVVTLADSTTLFSYTLTFFISLIQALLYPAHAFFPTENKMFLSLPDPEDFSESLKIQSVELLISLSKSE